MAALAKVLREHKAASGRSGPDDFVFRSCVGTRMHYRNVVRRGFDKTMQRAELGK